ncbi:MAG: M17 family peptidase N-terminal domain-containing protein, partial [Candidatus Nanopelagicales bacterium]
MTKLTLRFAATAPATTPADVLVVGVMEVNKKLTVVPKSLTTAQAKKIVTALTAVGAVGKPGEQTRIPGAGIAKANSILAVGIGSENSTEQLRQLAGDVTRALAG